MLETVVLLHIFFGTCDIFFLNSLINKVKKNTIYLKKFCVTIYNAIQKFGVSNFFYSLRN